MNFVTKASNFTRVSASGQTVLTSAPCVLAGIYVAGVTTAQFVQLWHGTDSTTPIIGTCSMAANSFNELPASLPDGLTYQVTNEEVDLTIFWSPLP